MRNQSLASEGAQRKLTSEDPEASDVIRFLRDNVGWYYCVECLSIESKAGVYDQQRKCDTCGKNKRSIAFLPRV